jgi:hypothetical protein
VEFGSEPRLKGHERSAAVLAIKGIARERRNSG